MASIRKRGAKWQVQIRRIGHPPLGKSFPLRADAILWARETERSLDRGELLPVDPAARRTTIGELLDRYEAEVSIAKRGVQRERFAIKALKAHGLARVRVNGLSSALLGDYRDHRLKTCSGTTVRRELAVLFHCLQIASREWGFPKFGKSLTDLRLPPLPPRRTRRLDANAEANLWAAIDTSSVPYLRPLAVLAVETGMRRGELLSLKWEHIDLARRIAWLPMTKNGSSRAVPLSTSAVDALNGLDSTQERPFMASPNAVRLAWSRLRTKAGLPSVRFHDLRHEAVSRLFERGLTAVEVASVSGHSDLRMLHRYAHARATEIAKKLR